MTVICTYKELEAQTGGVGGVGTLERRLPCRNGCDLFVGVRKPSNLHTFRVRFPQGYVPKLSDVPDFEDMELIQSSSFEEDTEFFTIQLRLTSVIFNDVFSCLVEDVANHIAEVVDLQQAASDFIARLIKWQRFLERHKPEGLTLEEQRGLFGELVFLVRHLNKWLPISDSVHAWTGPGGSAKDFVVGTLGIEVKTTISKQHQFIHINSEKQLDTTGLSDLFLFHFSLELTPGTGESLIEMVRQVRELANETAVLGILEDKLSDYGYLDIHESRYENSRYILKESNLYRIQEGFPRITESDLGLGVGEVRYTISVSECKHYTSNLDELNKLLEEQ